MRADLKADPSNVVAAEALSRLLLGNGQAEEALAVTAPFAATAESLPLLIRHVEALAALGRTVEALPTLERLATLAPDDGYVQQEFAAGLVEVGRYAEAEAVLAAVQAKGFEHPMAWQIRGVALQGLNRIGEAEAAYRSAVHLAPDYAGAHDNLARLVWMRTENVGAACEALDAALRILPAPPAIPLRMIKSRVLQYAGDIRGAYAEVADAGGHPGLEATASQMAIGFNPDRALEHARRALARAPDDAGVLAIAAEANLAAGNPAEALRLATALRQRAPLNQHGVALAATAWRLLSDPAYAPFSDYGALVKATKIETPAGWDSLDAYLADLAKALRELHGLQGHPVGQSLRGGSQTSQRLERSDDPVIRAFFQAVDAPIRAYLAGLGQGDDPVRARSTGDYAIDSAWSVRLRPGGMHVSHLHPAGWLSSAFYVALPDAVSAEGRKGWLAFGKPGVPTAPTLPSEHWVKPEPGLLVLFPSWMWHGTTPFAGDQDRLTVAFDVVPA